MALDAPTMIIDLRNHTGEDSSDISDDQALLLVNRSWWEVMDKFQFREKEFTATESTTTGVINYPVPQPFEAIRQISITDLTGQHNKLKRMLPSVYENVFNENVSQQSLPTHYIREGCMIRLWPTPDQIYTLTLKYWTILADLSTTGHVLPEIPQVWGEIILYGAVWRRFSEIGDLTRSGYFKNLQVGLINSTSPVETKEEYDSKESGFDVRGRMVWYK